MVADIVFLFLAITFIVGHVAYRISRGFQMHEQLGISRSDIVHLNNIRSTNQLQQSIGFLLTA